MPYRLTKIYTRKGDEGFTHLGKKRVSKDDFLVEAMGNVDELNSHIGLILSHKISDTEIEVCLNQVQNELFDLGGELFAPEHSVITDAYVTRLENWLDKWNDTLPPLKEFILPGGTPVSATAHVARTVCRRSERSLVRLHRQTPLANPELLRYLNRLSDLLFVIARVLNRKEDAEEKLWEHSQ